LWTGFTTLVRDGEGGVRHDTVGDIERQLGPVREGHPVRFREDTPAEQARARAEVAAWREQNPDGTAEEMLAALGSRFHKDYGPVLRSALFRADEQRDRRGTGAAAGTDPESR
jgi:hypothetical protein